MSSIKDKIYTVGDKEVIVTEDLDFYLENSSYSTLYVSEKIPNFDSIINKEIEHNGFKSWKNNITHDNSGNYDRKTARLRNKLLGNIEYKDGKFVSQGIEIQGQSLDIINKLGQELYTSFKKSLDIIAARIPAQSM